MKLMPIVYVTDMDRSLRFYQDLGFPVTTANPWWSELAAGEGAVLALHSAEGDPPTNGSQLELALVARERLEAVVATLAESGIHPTGDIVDQPFGRSLKIADPDGLSLQINEHDPKLFDDGHTVAGG